MGIAFHTFAKAFLGSMIDIKLTLYEEYYSKSCMMRQKLRNDVRRQHSLCMHSFYAPPRKKQKRKPFCDKDFPRDSVGIQTQDLQNRNLTLYSAKLRSRDDLREQKYNFFCKPPCFHDKINHIRAYTQQKRQKAWCIFKFRPQKCHTAYIK